MTTWRQDAARIIYEGTKHLPPDAPLNKRIETVDRLCPSFWRSMSWPQKAWQAARRDYLVPFGYVPKVKSKVPPEQEPLPLFEMEKADE